MMGAPQKSAPKTNEWRNRRYRLIQVALKQLGINDDAYRDMMDDLFNKRSAKNLSDGQLNKLVDHLKSLGFKPKRKAKSGKTAQQANTAEQGKIRALWISLWYLGVVRDNSDEALAAFCARVTGGKQTGIKALQWIRNEDALKVIEALKDWATREAGVDWSGYRIFSGSRHYTVHRPRARVIEALWRKLYALDAVKIGGTVAIGDYLHRPLKLECRKGHTQFTNDEADEAIRILGSKLRKAMEAQEQ